MLFRRFVVLFASRFGLLHACVEFLIYGFVRLLAIVHLCLGQLACRSCKTAGAITSNS
jgi:hypothetical protein